MNHTFKRLPPLSLYIHIPWCVRKCPYCDFNSYEQDGSLPVDAYVRALMEDLDADVELAQARPITSIFFGGGTPSLFPTAGIARILDGVRARLTLMDEAEISLETNPGTAEYSDFPGLRAAGVNRLSFGAQSFDDLQLQQLGRIHASDDIEKAVNRARDAGFDNYNIDLMHSLPGQDASAALRDIDRALALAPTHLSWYQLTIEPNTAYYSSPPTLPEEDTQADIYQFGLQHLQDAGFEQYEVSAFAKPGKASMHNLNYWQFGDYLAIGAGAHGKITRADDGSILRYQKTRSPRDYLAPDRAYLAKQQAISVDDLPLEFLMNAFRLRQGVPEALFQQRTGLSLETIETELTALRQDGLLAPDQDSLRLTERGHMLLNEVLGRFLAD